MVVAGVHDLVTVRGHVASPLECHGGLAGAWHTTEYRQVSGTQSAVKDSIKNREPRGNRSNPLDAALEVLDNGQGASTESSVVGAGHVCSPIDGPTVAAFTACS